MEFVFKILYENKRENMAAAACASLSNYRLTTMVGPKRRDILLKKLLSSHATRSTCMFTFETSFHVCHLHISEFVSVITYEIT